MSIKKKINRRIFTNGAFLEAFEIVLNGVKQWRWILIGQEGEAFSDGKEIEVYDYANLYEGLFVPQEKE